MKVVIKEIFKGTYDPSTNQVYNYTIIAQVESEKEIKIFDLYGYDLQNYIGKEINCLLYPWIGKKLPGFVIEGEFIGRINLNQNWMKNNKDLDLDAYFGIKTIDGTFLVNTQDVKEFNLKKGEAVKFYADRVDLLSWHPID